MAFVAIPGNTQYEYDNAPPDPGVGHPMRALWQKSANGIRTEHGQSNYVRCRRIGSGNVDHGEISKSYWDLRSTVSVYAILALDPKLVFDFTGNVFKTGGGISTFSNSVTHARAGNATMVDSDGLLKWPPHNLVAYSEDFTNSSWIESNNGSVAVDNAVAPDGTTTASTLTIAQLNSRIYQHVPKSFGIGEKYTFAFWVRSDTVTSIPFGIQGGINGANNDASTNTLAPVTSTWNLVEFEFTVLGNDNALYHLIGYISHNQAQTGDVEIWHPHAYRSDLGGMVNNSAQSTGFKTYVPTTSSAVYTPRVGHHVYNGSAWVNEGILHESEARTNLMTYSGDLTGADWEWGGGLIVGTVTTGSPFGNYQTISPRSSNAGTGAEQRYQIGKSITSGSTYVGWALVKYSAGSGWFTVHPYDTGKVAERAWFDLQNGVVGSKTSLIIDHGMVDYGDGWWLCWASSNAVAGSGGVVYEVTNGDGVRTCTATDVILIAGSQFEQGSTPSSYIPTSGSTVTRAAETLTVPAANLPYNSTNVSIQIDGKMTYADDGATAFFYRWLLNPTNYVQTVLQTGGSYEGRIRSSQRETTSGYDEVATSGSYFTPDINVPFNISSRHGSTFLNVAEGGTALTANTTVTALPNLSPADLLLGYIFMGTIAQFRVWDEDLTDAGIVEATEPSTEPSLQLTFDGSSTTSFTVLDWSE